MSDFGEERRRVVRLAVPERGVPDELERLRALVVHVERLLETFPVIEQAKGVLVATQGCDPEEAFDRLRRASQRMNMPLRDLARRLVDRCQGRDRATAVPAPPAVRRRAADHLGDLLSLGETDTLDDQ